MKSLDNGGRIAREMGDIKNISFIICKVLFLNLSLFRGAWLVEKYVQSNANQGGFLVHLSFTSSLCPWLDKTLDIKLLFITSKYNLL